MNISHLGQQCLVQEPPHKETNIRLEKPFLNCWPIQLKRLPKHIVVLVIDPSELDGKSLLKTVHFRKRFQRALS